MFLIIINKLACEEEDDDWKASGTRGWWLNPSGLGMSEHNCYFEGHLWPDIVYSRTAEQGLTHPWVWLCHSWSLTTKPGDKANNNCQTTLFISKVFFGCWFCFSDYCSWSVQMKPQEPETCKWTLQQYELGHIFSRRAQEEGCERLAPVSKCIFQLLPSTAVLAL